MPSAKRQAPIDNYMTNPPSTPKRKKATPSAVAFRGKSINPPSFTKASPVVEIHSVPISAFVHPKAAKLFLFVTVPALFL